MEIAVSRLGDMEEIAMISVSGVVDSETVERFGETLEKVFEDGCYNIILNIIADAYKKASQNRGSLKILKAGETIRELLEVVRFTKIIDIFEDEEEAVASFK